MNRKEERLLSPALSSTEEEREKSARRRFGGRMREWFRGILSPTGSRRGSNPGAGCIRGGAAVLVTIRCHDHGLLLFSGGCQRFFKLFFGGDFERFVMAYR